MERNKGIDWRLLLILYGLIVAAFIARALINAGTTPLLADTDDAMRMVVVRDFLAGQNWFDNIQHRLNTPLGAQLHWSRLADLPLAGAIVLLRPFLGGSTEIVAAYLVPLALLLVLLYLSGRIALLLVGREGLLPAFALPAMSLSVLTEFSPGRVDHHSLQILLLLAMTWCTIEALQRPRFAVGAGIAAATALAIGIESLPGVAAAILAFGLMWAFEPARAPALRRFGVSFALATLIHLVLALPPERWLTPACDAISAVYAAAASGTGIAFLILSLLPLATRPAWQRLVAGIVAGTLLAVMIALLFPQCLGGPYAALDPWLVTHWLNQIGEAAPLWTSMLDDPVYPAGVTVPVLLALAIAVWCAFRDAPDRREAWLVYVVFLVFAILTMLLQVRASRLATSLAVPACAFLIVAARRRYLERSTLPRIGGLVLAWLASAGLAAALVVMGLTQALPKGDSDAGSNLLSRRQCLMPASYAALAALPPQRAMTPIDLGAHVLLFTRHEVVAAPYHRNESGVRATFDFFNGPIGAARQILDARGVTLVVLCEALPEMRGLPDRADDSFLRLLSAGELPAWLVEKTTSGAPIRIFEVAPR